VALPTGIQLSGRFLRPMAKLELVLVEMTAPATEPPRPMQRRASRIGLWAVVPVAPQTTARQRRIGRGGFGCQRWGGC